MASKKERQEKKKKAQEERMLSGKTNAPKGEAESPEAEEEERWERPPRQEELAFEQDGRDYMTFYRITVMRKSRKGEMHRYEFGRKQMFLFFGTVFMLLALVCGILVLKENRRKNQLDIAQQKITTLQAQLASGLQSNEELTYQVSELNDKVIFLSQSLSAKTEALAVYQEKERAQHMPTAYPLRGNASFYLPEGMTGGMTGGQEEEGNENDPEQEDEGEEREPAVQFVTDVGSSMVATADGEVEEVNLLEDGSYTILIDHGNGYMTVYSGAGTIMVKEGDSVTAGTILLGVTEGNTVLSYQILLNGEYIDPWECMEIYG